MQLPSTGATHRLDEVWDALDQGVGEARLALLLAPLQRGLGGAGGGAALLCLLGLDLRGKEGRVSSNGLAAVERQRRDSDGVRAFSHDR